MHDDGNDPARAGRSSSMDSGWKSIGLILVLLLVGIINYADRELPYLIAESLKKDFALSDFEIGFINGLGFLLLYSIVGIPIARIADRGAYARVIVISVAVWSAMTALGSFARNGAELALSRLGVAVGEAGSTPAAHALVASRFRLSSQGKVFAALSLSAPLGSMIGLMFGGIFTEKLGWRTTFLLFGIAGLLIAVLAAVVLRSGQKGGAAAEPARGSLFRESWRLLRNPAFFRLITAGSLLAMASYSVATWAPALLIRTHGMRVDDVGLQYGVAKAAVALVLVFAAGLYIDRTPRESTGRLPRATGLFALAVSPITFAALQTTSTPLALLCLGVANGFGMAYLAPTVATVQRHMGPAQRALGSALLLMITNIIGGCGPLLVGAISDALSSAGHGGALASALMIAPALQLAAAAAFWWAGSTDTKDMNAQPSLG